jgi:hypothetical protein
MCIRERQKYRGPLKGIMRHAAKRMEEKEPQTYVYGDTEPISKVSSTHQGVDGCQLTVLSTLKNRTNVMIKEATNEHLNKVIKALS